LDIPTGCCKGAIKVQHAVERVTGGEARQGAKSWEVKLRPEGVDWRPEIDRGKAEQGERREERGEGMRGDEMRGDERRSGEVEDRSERLGKQAIEVKRLQLA
jgi:hypothetical protein